MTEHKWTRYAPKRDASVSAIKYQPTINCAEVSDVVDKDAPSHTDCSDLDAPYFIPKTIRRGKQGHWLAPGDWLVDHGDGWFDVYTDDEFRRSWEPAPTDCLHAL